MGSTPYTIGPNGPAAGSANTAIYQPGRPHGVVTVYNTGTATVYLDSDAPVASTDGLPLSAGSSIPWDEDLPLYAVCPTSTTIVVSDNTSIGFDAGAIAAQLNSQGLAAGIAAAIKISGAPPIDALASITTFTNSTNGTALNSAVFDVSAYQSLTLAATATADTTLNIRVAVNWCDSAGVLLFSEDFFIGTGGMSNGSIIVRGPKVFFGIIITGVVGAPAVLKVYGSYKALASNYMQIVGFGASGSGQIDGQARQGFQTWYGVIPVSTTWVAQFDHIAGPVQMIMRYVGANTSGVTRILRIPNSIYSLTTYASDSALPITTGLMTQDNLYLPPVPLELSMANLSATQTLTFRATLVYNRPWAA